jgi:hypothetical protein
MLIDASADPTLANDPYIIRRHLCDYHYGYFCYTKLG